MLKLTDHAPIQQQSICREKFAWTLCSSWFEISTRLHINRVEIAQKTRLVNKRVTLLVISKAELWPFSISTELLMKLSTYKYSTTFMSSYISFH